MWSKKQIPVLIVLEEHRSATVDSATTREGDRRMTVRHSVRGCTEYLLSTRYRYRYQGYARLGVTPNPPHKYYFLR